MWEELSSLQGLGGSYCHKSVLAFQYSPGMITKSSSSSAQLKDCQAREFISMNFPTILQFFLTHSLHKVAECLPTRFWAEQTGDTELKKNAPALWTWTQISIHIVQSRMTDGKMRFPPSDAFWDIHAPDQWSSNIKCTTEWSGGRTC